MNPQEHLLDLRLVGELSELYKSEEVFGLLHAELTPSLMRDRKGVFKALEEALEGFKSEWQYECAISTADTGYVELVNFRHRSHTGSEIMVHLTQGINLVTEMPFVDTDPADLFQDLHGYLRARSVAHTESVVAAYPLFVKKLLKLFGDRYRLRRTDTYEVYSVLIDPNSRRSHEMACQVTIIPKSRAIVKSRTMSLAIQ